MQRPLAGLTRRNLVTELTAGVTLLAIAIPLNIGYAQIAGLPPTAGLYALIVPTLIYALVVSSRQLVVSPDAAAAALVASSIGGLAAAGSADYATLALAQAIISGILFLLMAVFKLGFLASFLSKPILVGFVGGLALDIMVSQIAKMLGVKIDSGGEFVEKVSGLILGLNTFNAWSLGVAAASVAVLLLGRRFLPRIPWALVVLIVSTIVVVVADLDDRGVDVLGEVPAGPPGADVARPRLDDVAGARAVRDRAHPRHDRRGSSGVALVRREARLSVRREPGPARLRSRQHRRRRAGQLRHGRLDIAHRGDGPGRLPHPAAVARARGGNAAAAAVRHRAARGHPIARHRRRRRGRDPAAAGHPRVPAAVASGPLRVRRRGHVLPRHAVRRRDSRHPGRVRARAHQSRQARRESDDRRARGERRRQAVPAGGCPHRGHDRARPGRGADGRPAVLRQRRGLHLGGQARRHRRRPAGAPRGRRHGGGHRHRRHRRRGVRVPRALAPRQRRHARIQPCPAAYQSPPGGARTAVGSGVLRHQPSGRRGACRPRRARRKTEDPVVRPARKGESTCSSANRKRRSGRPRPRPWRLCRSTTSTISPRRSAGILGTLDDPKIRNDEGDVVWDASTYDFIQGDAPDTVHPSLWRQSTLVAKHGLFEVVEGHLSGAGTRPVGDVVHRGRHRRGHRRPA